MWEIKKIIKKGAYDYALVPNHPNATKNGYVLLHRIVMENHINRLLKDNEVVHHKDFNKHNNDISNLQLMTKEEHTRLHSSLQGKTYAEIECPVCRKRYIKLKRECVDKKQYNCSRHCGRLFQLLSPEEKKERVSHCVIRIFKQ